MLFFLTKMYDDTCYIALNLFGFRLNPVLYILFLAVFLFLAITLFGFLIFFGFC